MGKQTKVEIKSDMILSRLRQHLNEQRPVTLHNTFEGLPISYEAEVAMIHPDYVGLIVHPYQAVCIKLERRTYLKSKFLPELIRAYPVSIDYTNHVVLLKRLKIPKSISVDLQNTWVAPEKPVSVTLSSDDRQDLSVSLMEIAVLDKNSVRVVMEVPEDAPYERQDPVALAFRLQSKGDLLQVQGVVHSVVKIRNQARKRMEVRGQAAMQDEISILAYIAQREDQIMKTLDKMYSKLRKGKKHRKRN